MPTNEAAWLEQHAEVLFDVDRRGRLTGLNEPDPERAPPRVFLARGRGAFVMRLRDDVPDAAAPELASAVADLAPWDGERSGDDDLGRLRQIVRASLGAGDESAGPAYRFPAHAPRIHAADVVMIDDANAHLLDRNFPFTRSVLERRSPVVGVVRDGAVVSACYSARRRVVAAEAGVDTIEAYRGTGLAVAVVAGWARAAARHGMTPLYSTSWDNAASLRVALKLGLEIYADTVSFA